MLIVAGFAVAALWWRFDYVFPSGVAAKLGTAAQPGNSIELAQLTTFEWDRVVFLGPYTDRERAETALQVSWPEFPLFGLESGDSFSLIAFVRGSRITQVERIVRCQPDFDAKMLEMPILKANARFRFVAGDGCTAMVVA
ncbi:MAG: hypothetical protein U1F54_14545 [Burkholderiales bacterium]